MVSFNPVTGIYNINNIADANPMSHSTKERVRWTIADIELLPDNGNRYEIIDGDLFVTKITHWSH